LIETKIFTEWHLVVELNPQGRFRLFKKQCNDVNRGITVLLFYYSCCEQVSLEFGIETVRADWKQPNRKTILVVAFFKYFDKKTKLHCKQSVLVFSKAKLSFSMEKFSKLFNCTVMYCTVLYCTFKYGNLLLLIYCLEKSEYSLTELH
jgi:hypothetical protein